MSAHAVIRLLQKEPEVDRRGRIIGEGCAPNIKDILLHMPEYHYVAELWIKEFGVTDKELRTFFHEVIPYLAKKGVEMRDCKGYLRNFVHPLFLEKIRQNRPFWVVNSGRLLLINAPSR